MTEPGPQDHPPERPWAFPALLALVLALVVGWRLLPFDRPAAAPPAQPQSGEVEPLPGEVEVVVQIDGTTLDQQHVPPTGGTVLAVLQAAGGESPAFAPEVRGEGAGAFVVSVGGVANEGAGGRNWTYSVNGQPGDRSAAIAPVKDGDRVLWKFTPPE